MQIVKLKGVVRTLSEPEKRALGRTLVTIHDADGRGVEELIYKRGKKLEPRGTIAAKFKSEIFLPDHLDMITGNLVELEGLLYRSPANRGPQDDKSCVRVPGHAQRDSVSPAVLAGNDPLGHLDVPAVDQLKELSCLDIPSSICRATASATRSYPNPCAS